MLHRPKLIRWIAIGRLSLLYTLTCCTFAASLSYAQMSDEDGLRLRRQQMPKKNTVQRIVAWPYTVVRLPFFVTGRAIGYTVTFIDDTQLFPRVKDFLTSDDGLVSLYPTASFGGRSGLTGELTFSDRKFLKQGNRLGLHTSYSVEAHQNHYARYQAYDLIGSLYLDIRGRYNVNTNEDFFGIGPDISDVKGDGDQEDETNFRHEQLGGDLTIGVRWRKFFGTEVLINFTDHIIKEGEGTRSKSTLSSEFNRENTPGLEGAALIGVGGRIVFDTRDNDFYPSKGLLAAVSATVFDQTDDSKYGFTRYNLELSHYLTLFRRGRIFAVRLLGEINTRTSDNETPFFERVSLGGTGDLRGYNTGRFRDKDLILLNLEYRYPIWDAGVDQIGAMDAVLFVDIGRVFDDLMEDTFKNYKISYGGGIRARTTTGFLLRAEFAHSDEENKVLFRFEPMF